MHQRMLRRMPSSSSTAGRSRARRGRPRCRRRSSCPSRRARAAAAGSGRCVGPTRRRSRRRAPAIAGRRVRLGATSKPSSRSARPTVSTISVTAYGRASAIHQPRPGGRRHQLGAQHAVDEVVDVHHRAHLVAVADHREPAGAHQLEERRLARRLERSVEPRRSHDHGVEPGLDGVEHGQLGLPSSTARSRSTGGTARRCGSGRRGAGWCRTGCSTTRARTGARQRAGRRARASLPVPATLTVRTRRPGADGSRLPCGSRRLDPSSPANSGVERRRIGDVADDRLDAVGRASRSRSASTRLVTRARIVPGRAPRPIGVGERVHQRRARASRRRR